MTKIGKIYTAAGNFLSVILFVITAFGCSNQENTVSGTENADTLYIPRHAERFALFHKGDTILLKVTDPWQGARSVEKTYICPEPYRRIIAMSTSHLAALSALNEEDSVIGVSGKEYIYDSSYRSVTDIGYDNHLEFEKVLSLKPDVMFVYEVTGECSSIFRKLGTLGINTVYIADYLESSPLGRAEWIVVFGALTGKLNEAVSYFREIERLYSEVMTRSQVPSSHRKKVIINSPYRGTWFFPGKDSYIVRLVEDAGGQYVGSEYAGKESYPVDMETAYRHLQSADIWINPSIGVQSRDDIAAVNAQLKNISIPLFGNDRRTTLMGGSDFYESGAIRPDLILRDLTMIFRDMENVKKDSLYFYRELK